MLRLGWSIVLAVFVLCVVEGAIEHATEEGVWDVKVKDLEAQHAAVTEELAKAQVEHDYKTGKADFHQKVVAVHEAHEREKKMSLKNLDGGLTSMAEQKIMSANTDIDDFDSQLTSMTSALNEASGVSNERAAMDAGLEALKARSESEQLQMSQIDQSKYEEEKGAVEKSKEHELAQMDAKQGTEDAMIKHYNKMLEAEKARIAAETSQLETTIAKAKADHESEDAVLNAKLEAAKQIEKATTESLNSAIEEAKDEVSTEQKHALATAVEVKESKKKLNNVRAEVDKLRKESDDTIGARIAATAALAATKEKNAAMRAQLLQKKAALDEVIRREGEAKATLTVNADALEVAETKVANFQNETAQVEVLKGELKTDESQIAAEKSKEETQATDYKAALDAALNAVKAKKAEAAALQVELDEARQRNAARKVARLEREKREAAREALAKITSKKSEEEVLTEKQSEEELALMKTYTVEQSKLKAEDDATAQATLTELTAKLGDLQVEAENQAGKTQLAIQLATEKQATQTELAKEGDKAELARISANFNTTRDEMESKAEEQKAKLESEMKSFLLDVGEQVKVSDKELAEAEAAATAEVASASETWLEKEDAADKAADERFKAATGAAETEIANVVATITTFNKEKLSRAQERAKAEKARMKSIQADATSAEAELEQRRTELATEEAKYDVWKRGIQTKTAAEKAAQEKDKEAIKVTEEKIAERRQHVEKEEAISSHLNAVQKAYEIEATSLTTKVTTLAENLDVAKKTHEDAKAKVTQAQAASEASKDELNQLEHKLREVEAAKHGMSEETATELAESIAVIDSRANRKARALKLEEENAKRKLVALQSKESDAKKVLKQGH